MPAMQTRLTEMLGIEHPVMLAGMGGVSYAPLAAAVSNAGGIGTLGASTMGTDEMAAQIAAVAAATDRPFGVDLLTAAPQDMTAKVHSIAAGGGSLFVAGLGVPGEVIDQAMTEATEGLGVHVNRRHARGRNSGGLHACRLASDGGGSLHRFRSFFRAFGKWPEQATTLRPHVRQNTSTTRDTRTRSRAKVRV